MAVTAQWVFERAIQLMDEGDERTGRNDTAETKPYKLRALGILNVLGEECARVLGQEPWRELLDFGQAVSLDEGAARELLPYGLAAHLFLGEDPAAANFFQQRYEELLAQRQRRSRGDWRDIYLPYGDLEAVCDGGYWKWR